MTDVNQSVAQSDSAWIAIGSVVNGLSAYAMVVVVSRVFDDIDFAAYSVAWSIWALSVAVLVFPLQHWIIWRSTVDSGTGGVRRALPHISLVLLVVLGALYLAGSSRRLFPEGDSWGLILVVTGASSAILGFARGLLAADDRYRAVAWVIGSENVVRLGVVVAVVTSGLGPQAAALAIAAGPIVLIPFLKSLRWRDETLGQPVRILRELGALAGATALAQVLVQFPPAFAEWLGDSPVRVAGIFATFSIGRAPLLILLALTTRLTEPLTGFLSAVTSDEVVLVRRAVTWTVVGIVSAFSLGWLVGPPIVTFIFGQGRALSGLETAMISAGLAVAMAGFLLILVLMAENKSAAASIYWLLAVLGASGLGFVGVGIPAAFLLAEIAALVLTLVTAWRLVSAKIRPPAA